MDDLTCDQKKRDEEREESKMGNKLICYCGGSVIKYNGYETIFRCSICQRVGTIHDFKIVNFKEVTQ